MYSTLERILHIVLQDHTPILWVSHLNRIVLGQTRSESESSAEKRRLQSHDYSRLLTIFH